MQVDRLILGAYETNCYIVRRNPGVVDVVIIDTGLEAGEMIDFLSRHKLNPTTVIFTHGHVDHINGLAVLRQNYPTIKVYLHKLDAGMFAEPHANLSVLTGTNFAADAPDVLVEQSDVIEQAGIKLEVIHTPGHTPGGICLYAEEHSILFTGDTLFAGSVGRADFPGGSMTQLVNGIKQKLCTLPDETVCYPGHGPETTIAEEKANNQYLH